MARKQAILELYHDYAKGKNRVRPCPGQGLNTDWNVRFPNSLRKYPVGTKFLATIKEGHKQYMTVKGEIEVLQTDRYTATGQPLAQQRPPRQPTTSRRKSDKIRRRKIVLDD